MSDHPAAGATDGDCTQIEWHRQAGDHQVLVSVEGASVRIAVALGPETPRTAVEAACEELLREFDHHAGDDGSPVPVQG